MIISQKELFDKKIIDSALKKNFKNKAKELQTHVIYAGTYYSCFDICCGSGYHMRSFILKGMKKYKIKSVMLTSIRMVRKKLITKEKMLKYCTGNEYMYEKEYMFEKNSINDELESFFEDYRLGNTPRIRAYTYNYHLPKLTEEELILTERKDRSYFETFIGDPEPIVSSNEVFYWGLFFRREEPIRQNIDVEEAEMKASESNSKYVLVKCSRETYTIENSSSLNCSHSCSLQ